ncbi:MAG: hypothetical protein JW946_06105 [Candidatus Omnitrophica bacterium]|nr:hypothetical protein [Candidatus Omnitrophota bacterium]
MKKPKYYLNKSNEFVVENFHLPKPFFNFFPGIAGVWGVPIWCFYTNRGQAIAGFGIRGKEHPIMEFYPANKAVSRVSIEGFRTFIKISNKKSQIFYDAFNSSTYQENFDIENKIIITPYDLRLIETNHTLGLEVEIEYFTIPNDNYGALARVVTIKNLTNKNLKLDVLDGIAQIIPYGFDNKFLKYIAKTIEAWIDIENLDKKIPYLRLKVDAADKPEVIRIKEGNFYLAFDKQGLIKPIVDPDAVFSNVRDFTYPEEFLKKGPYNPYKNQFTKNKIPCCMAYKKFNIPQRSQIHIYSLIGNSDSIEKLNKNAKRISHKNYILKKRQENKEIIQNLTLPAFTDSASDIFNSYCRQNFLDNILRGGFPYSIKHKNGRTNLQLFSRRHGDLERDYNNFLIEPNYFSQGNGAFRDINQNRRNDIWFNPQIKDENIFTFFNLIQSDGYNPLVIKPDTFVFNQNFNSIKGFFKNKGLEQIKIFLKRHFAIGEMFTFMEQNRIHVFGKREDLLTVILENSEKLHNAEHGEGFWIDHWYYCIDLLESYQNLYPEEIDKILFQTKEFTFFDSAKFVKPRSERFMLKNDAVFQVHSVEIDHKKAHLIEKRAKNARIKRDRIGEGQIYKTTLIVKMLVAIANKLASLDPFGIGVEMEADKPGWCDSLNGLPGLLGSSACETLELKKWLIFIKKNLNSSAMKKLTIELPKELYDFIFGLNKLCRGNLGNYLFWDKSHTLKEQYRKDTFFGFNGAEKELAKEEMLSIVDNFLKKIEIGIRKSCRGKTKLCYSYFINEVTDYRIINTDSHGRKFVKPLTFKQAPLPLFLEGIVHSLKTTANEKEAKIIFNETRKSAIFDKKLKMYKICAPLDEMPLEIGRMRIFTPGWLENESIWLHMEYKYLLELLKNGMHEEFFKEAKNCLIPFQPPARYGRSILENCSFIASSVFYDEKLHGNGFIARLSGSTAEFIHMWLMMCAGKRPFYLDNYGKLRLELKPILPSWLFFAKGGSASGGKRNTFSFRFLNKTTVVYHNPKAKNTFGKAAPKIKSITIKPFNKKAITLNTPFIPAPFSYDARDGKIEQIDIVLS